MDLFDNIEKMWFGTERKMTWIDTPNTGAAAGSIGSNASAVLLGGGGSVRQSVDSHKGYQFSWGESADQRLVSLMESYRNGSYGRGLLYFSDPMYYRTNVLPKRHADPSMAVNWEAEPLVRDVSPTAVPRCPRTTTILWMPRATRSRRASRLRPRVGSFSSPSRPASHLPWELCSPGPGRSTFARQLAPRT